MDACASTSPMWCFSVFVFARSCRTSKGLPATPSGSALKHPRRILLKAPSVSPGASHILLQMKYFPLLLFSFDFILIVCHFERRSKRSRFSSRSINHNTGSICEGLVFVSQFNTPCNMSQYNSAFRIYFSGLLEMLPLVQRGDVRAHCAAGTCSSPWGRKPVERAGPLKVCACKALPASVRTVNGSVCVLGYYTCMCWLHWPGNQQVCACVCVVCVGAHEVDSFPESVEWSFNLAS